MTAEEAPFTFLRRLDEIDSSLAMLRELRVFLPGPSPYQLAQARRELKASFTLIQGGRCIAGSEVRV